MGVLPSTAQGQSLEDAYTKAAQYSEFVPVWGRPTPFYNLADDLGGGWGEIFVKQLIRNRGMFPIVHLSFFGEGVTLVTPPGMEEASLIDSGWRAEYKKAAESLPVEDEALCLVNAYYKIEYLMPFDLSCFFLYIPYCAYQCRTSKTEDTHIPEIGLTTD